MINSLCIPTHRCELTKEPIFKYLQDRISALDLHVRKNNSNDISNLYM